MENNLLYYGDNLRILREHISDNSIDLIYLDPPFNSKANYNVLYKEYSDVPSEAQITAFEDSWHWTQTAEETYTEIIKMAPAEIIEMMKAFREFIGSNDVMAYLTMMCIRLIELKRVLKETGSIYLHCDSTASHYLKILMDSIFGKMSFKNEIVWSNESSSGYKSQVKTKFVRGHDIILFYSNKNADFNIHYLPLTESTIQRYDKIDKEGRRYKIYFEDNGSERRQYLDKSKGRKLSDTWTDLPSFQTVNANREWLGYPTQKPIRLLERIITASSNDNDLVLDPFCGCGTTIITAQKLKRRWIGIDITHLAINLIKMRLKDMFILEPKIDYKVMGEPEDLTGAKELAVQNRYQFQWWALSLIEGARPYGNKKKGTDKGIDGYVYFQDEKEKVKRGIVQVKSGHVSVKDIRDLEGVIDREKAEIGIFITLENPTKDMVKEAITKGFYHSESWGKDYRRIQILTIEELLSGKKPEMPYAPPVYKQAEKHVPSEDEMYHGEIQ